MRRVPLWLFGVGGVGSTLLAMLSDDEVRSRIESRTGCEFVPVFLADSSGYMLQPEGLPAELLPAVQVIKQARRPLTELRGARQCASPDEAFEALRSAVDLPASIGVDATASDAMGPILVRAVEAGGAVALANKRPLTAGYAQFEALTASRRCRHEATVGAGLPVIATLYSLLDSGDSVSSIVGCFSGTLAYLCSALNRGEPYSRAVARAVEAGYAEPDPRDDLNGMDVARKALILSRMLGRRLELSDVRVSDMIPPELKELSREEFMRRLPEADAEMRGIVEGAAARGMRLAYVADLTEAAPRVALQEVDPHTPVGQLRGTDNLALFYTARYNENPLAIQGPGAGRAVTAGGVLSDIITLAREVLR